ncbi:sulfur carrier protein ThiS [Catenovulum sp. SM1970]|uniref:sulfur carrier protein ThiS n=1 Tax=Marinifaba aquimaris TaxID=2741323 RepID=UPI001573AA4A|nr:sulfur carrier protein ThiS [Marinifaba aquimaris]NTS77134.1 sulfur carrier protein ThiS [Marinifaba aquimaris]
MIDITVNGQNHSVAATDINNVAIELSIKPPFAVALNGDFISKDEYHTQVNSGDSLEFLSPIQGG